MCTEPLVQERVAARVQHRPEVDERRAHLRVLGDVDDVGRDREAEPDAQAGALHRREGGCREGSDPAHEALDRLEVSGDVVGLRLHTRDVAARAERSPLAPKHECADTGVRGAAVCGIQLGQSIERERVELVGGVEGDLGQVVGDREVDHGSSYTS